jgi:hypothetical protein
MDQNKINEATKDCISYTIGAQEPLQALQHWIDQRAAEGWPKDELAIIKHAAVRMLSAIYGIEDRHGDKQ